MAQEKRILIPTDFTPVAENAIEHALNLAGLIKAEIYLLHIVEKPNEIDSAKEKLEEAEAKIKATSPSVKVNNLVRIGNIFEDIADVAAEIDAEIIFMGTHGVKGMQHLLGSRALKVITNSDVPFVVVQNRKIEDYGYDNIVVPIDFSIETKQKLAYVANMAKYFESKVHLIAPKETDEWLSAKITRNLNYAKQFLEENKIESTIKIDEEKGSNFAKHIIRYSAQINADLITIMNLNKNGLLGVLGSSYEQTLLTNEAEVPVMIVNPFQATVGGGKMLFG